MFFVAAPGTGRGRGVAMMVRVWVASREASVLPRRCLPGAAGWWLCCRVVSGFPGVVRGECDQVGHAVVAPVAGGQSASERVEHAAEQGQVFGSLAEGWVAGWG